MLKSMEQKPDGQWPTGTIWSFKNQERIYGTPMLDAAIEEAMNLATAGQALQELINELRNPDLSLSEPSSWVLQIKSDSVSLLVDSVLFSIVQRCKIASLLMLSLKDSFSWLRSKRHITLGAALTVTSSWTMLPRSCHIISLFTAKTVTSIQCCGMSCHIIVLIMGLVCGLFAHLSDSVASCPVFVILQTERGSCFLQAESPFLSQRWVQAANKNAKSLSVA